MKTKQSIITLAAGILIGASMVGPMASAAEEYLQARRSTQQFFVDGQRVELEAYAIGGHNYVKLRDIGKAVDFSVSYDPLNNAAIVVSGVPYREEQPATVPSAPAPRPTPSPDYAAQANPAVFTDELNREVYNGIRDTILHREEIIAGTYQPISAGEIRWNGSVEQAASTLGQCPIYEIVRDEDGQAVCNTRYAESYEPAKEHTQEFIDGLSGLSDWDKAEELVYYVCDRMTYEVKYPGPGEVLSQDGVVPGCCMAYSYAFQFLCDRTGIPCILVCNDIHMWNQVYLDGQWWGVDVTASDAGDETQHRTYSNYSPIHALSEFQGKTFLDGYPEVTAFAKELLVPGSAK